MSWPTCECGKGMKHVFGKGYQCMRIGGYRKNRQKQRFPLNLGTLEREEVLNDEHFTNWENDETPEARLKNTHGSICFDFDGVIHSYSSPWEAIDKIPDPPTPGALETIRAFLSSEFEVAIFSVRSRVEEGLMAMKVWLIDMGMRPEEVEKIEFPTTKPKSLLYVDDRGYHFKGDNWPSVDFLRRFQPWNRTQRHLAKFVGSNIPQEVIDLLKLADPSMDLPPIGMVADLSPEERKAASVWAYAFHLSKLKGPGAIISKEVPMIPLWLDKWLRRSKGI